MTRKETKISQRVPLSLDAMIRKETRISQRIPLSLDSKLKEAAKSMNVKRAVLVRAALTQYLENLNKIENPAA